MGGASPPASHYQADDHPNQCDHPYARVEAVTANVLLNGALVERQTVQLCTRCDSVRGSEGPIRLQKSRTDCDHPYAAVDDEMPVIAKVNETEKRIGRVVFCSECQGIVEDGGEVELDRLWL